MGWHDAAKHTGEARKGRMRWACLGAGGLVGPFGGFAPAAGAVPMTVSCGSTINASGVYVLAADCKGAGIEITASNVTLNLNGHSMTEAVAVVVAARVCLSTTALAR